MTATPTRHPWLLITLPLWIAPALVLVFLAAIGFGMVLGVMAVLDGVDTVVASRCRAARVRRDRELARDR